MECSITDRGVKNETLYFVFGTAETWIEKAGTVRICESESRGNLFFQRGWIDKRNNQIQPPAFGKIGGIIEFPFVKGM